MDPTIYDKIDKARNALKPLSSRTSEETEKARQLDRQVHSELRILIKRGENSTCADCGAAWPGWASLPHGIFICINCAQIHRHLGRHISQVKAVNTGTYLWYPDEVNLMKTIGNARANALYLGAAPEGLVRPHEKSPRDEILQFARAKYEQRKWILGAPIPSPSPTMTRFTRELSQDYQVSSIESEEKPKARIQDLLLSFDDVSGIDAELSGTDIATVNPEIPYNSIAENVMTLYKSSGDTAFTGSLPQPPMYRHDHNQLSSLSSFPVVHKETLPIPQAPMTTPSGSTLGGHGQDFFSLYGL